MSQVFEGYERQYCELSANLSKKCTSAGLLNGGKAAYVFFLSFVRILKLSIVIGAKRLYQCQISTMSFADASYELGRSFIYVISITGCFSNDPACA